MEAEGEKILRSNASPFLTGTRFPLRTSVSASRSPPREAVNLTLMSQYLDVIEKMGCSTNTKTVFMPYGPEGVSRISDEIRNATLQGRE